MYYEATRSTLLSPHPQWDTSPSRSYLQAFHQASLTIRHWLIYIPGGGESGESYCESHIKLTGYK